MSVHSIAGGAGRPRVATVWATKAAVPLALAVGSALYLWPRLDRDWFPWDEGTLAEPAARILRGELPHRDFVDAYTGALSYVHAAAFSLFGQELTSLRLVLFAFFVAWVPALYFVASRLLRRLEAVGMTLVAIAWSVPNYPASMPSWYCTFFATFGIAALFRHLETGRRRWIFVAGLCAGASITMKVVGVYFVVAVLLYLAFKASTDRSNGRGRIQLARVVTVLAVLLSLAVIALLRTELGVSVVVNFAVPVIALAAFAVLSARAGSGSLGALTELAAPFILGVAVPVAAFAAPYVASNAVGDLLGGVFPSSRLSFAALSPPSVLTLIALLPLVPILYVPRGLRDAKPWERAIPVAVLLAVALGASGTRLGYAITWQSLRAVVPVLTVGGLNAVHRRRDALPDPRVPQRIVLLLASAAMCSLVQYPYSAPVYFAYVAPLVILAVGAVLLFTELVPRSVLWILIAFYLLFGVIRLNPSPVLDLGTRSERATMQRLDVSRGGLDVPSTDAREYERLVSLVQRHSGTSRYIYATPDSPEVYFLSGTENPTASLFELLDRHPARAHELVNTLAARKVNVVVINRHPFVYDASPASIQRVLVDRYPRVAYAGRFEIRWRAAPRPS